ncbi:MAG: NDP-sugar synthase, partial [Planctomycetes bacterium]|nr:NDP-sugar synthase [Planctomycetota bacterium]
GIMKRKVEIGVTGRARCSAQEASTRPATARRADPAGIILAGVHNWGDGILEATLCRPLLPVAMRPLIAHVIEWLGQVGATNLSVCGNSDSAALHRCLGDGGGLGVTLDYYADRMPRGPAGCARDAARMHDADTFIVVDGTILPQFDLQELLGSHRDSGAHLTVAVSNASPRPGAPAVPPSPIGVYVFSAEVFDHVPPVGYQDIKESLIPALHAKGQRVCAFVVRDETVCRVSGAASYLSANGWAIDRMTEEEIQSGGLVWAGEAMIHRTALVDRSARLVGPVLVGPEAVVGANVLLVGSTTIGPGCIIEPSAVISRSVLWEGCRIGAGAIVDYCVLTDGAGLESGIVVRNTVLTRARSVRPNIVDRLSSRLRFPRPGDRRAKRMPA